jgi:uncharacterized protein YceK
MIRLLGVPGVWERVKKDALDRRFLASYKAAGRITIAKPIRRDSKMFTRIRMLGALLVLLLLSGCGTLCNLPETPGMFHLNGAATRRIYGGVRLDAHFGTRCITASFQEQSSEFGRAGTFAMGAYALFVDLPISAAADTVTLPYVLYQGPGKTYWEQFSSSPAPVAEQPD